MDISIQELPASWYWRAVRAGLTLKTVAELSETSHPNLCKWVKGGVSPTHKSICRIEEVFAKHGDVITVKVI